MELVLRTVLALCPILDLLYISHWNFTAEKAVARLVKRIINWGVLLPTAEWIHGPSCPQPSCPGQLSSWLLHGSSGGEWGMSYLSALTVIWDCASCGCCTTWKPGVCNGSVAITENLSTMSDKVFFSSYHA